MTELREVQLEALLHDIGKFEQRKGAKGKHAKIGSEFIGKYFPQEVTEIVSLHHEDIEDIPQEKKKDTLMIKISDHISSGEREEREKGEHGEPRAEPMLSIFTKIAIGKGEAPDKKYYPIKPLSLDERIFPRSLSDYKDEKNIWNLEGEYSNQWGDFVKELDKVGTDFETFYHLLWKYTWCVPSAIWRDVPDIALFDHLRTSAAIAVCLKFQSLSVEKLEELFKGVNKYWRLKQNKEAKNIEEMKQQVEEIQDDSFVLIGGDISGIQDFIYNIKSPQEAQKGMAKRLRGRSFYLGLLGESIAHYILERLNLPITNLLWCSGGHFFILAPAKFLDEISSIEKDVNTMMLKKFQGDLFMILGWERGSAFDLMEFPQYLDKVKEKIAFLKKQKALSVLKESNLNLTKSVHTEKAKVQGCIICGLDFTKKDEEETNKCDLCIQQEEIGKKLPRVEYLKEVISNEKPKACDVLFELGEGESPRFIGWRISEKPEDIDFGVEASDSRVRVYRVNNTDLDFSLPRDVPRAFKFYGKSVPQEANTVMSLDKVGKFPQGIERVGMLRMDVDDLGRIFSEGLEKSNRTVSRISTLSRMMDMFFAGYLNSIAKRFGVFRGLCRDCEENFQEKNGVTVYEGDIKFEDEEKEKKYFLVTKDGISRADLACRGCRKKNNFTPLIYITYSGGDDLFVAGPWDMAIDFASTVKEEFSKYVAHNPNLTISGGHFTCRSRFPIGRAARIAGDSLEHHSKAHPDKDAMTLFGETVKWKCNSGNSYWNGLDMLLRYGKTLEDYVEKDKISRGFLYSILSFWKESFAAIKRDRDYIPCDEAVKRCSYLPRFKYLLTRNVSRKTDKEKKVFTDLDKNIPKIVPLARIPVTWAVLKNRGDKKWKPCPKT